MMAGKANILGIFAALVVGVFGFEKALPAPTDFSSQQARGKVIYDDSCAVCHGAISEGGAAPALGPSSKLTVVPVKASVDDLALWVRANMPQNDPGTLSRQASLDVTVFMLGCGAVAPKDQSSLCRSNIAH